MANKTVNLPLKSLMARLASSRVVLWALETHGPRLAEIFNGPLGRSLPEELREIFGQHVSQLRAVLASARDLMVTTDRNLRDQKALTTRYRRLRDEAFNQLSPAVAGVRDTFRGACGPEVVEELGFAVRMPVQAGELHEQAEHLTARLSEPDMELPTVRFKGVDLDPASLAGEMKPLVERLGQALEDVTQGERQTEAYTIAKDEALDAYDRTFLWVGRSAESLFKLADLPKVAKRVRPSTRRSGITDEQESQDPDLPVDDPAVPAAGGDGALVAPSDDPPVTA